MSQGDGMAILKKIVSALRMITGVREIAASRISTW
jgi:hypothetical protein